MNDVLARLHLVDWKAVGLAEFGRPGDYYARQIHRWSQQYRASETEKIEAMERLMEWLPKNIPASAETTLVHGDYRPGNMIVHPSEPRVVAVLDWELSTLGHPMADLASTCMPYHLGNEWEGLRDAPLAELGIPTEAEYSPRTAAAPGVPASSTGTSTSRSPSSGWPPSRRGSWDASSPAPPTTPTRASAASARARWPKPAGASWGRAGADGRCAPGRSAPLEQSRRAHAAADAHGADDVARAAALALDERVADHARAAHAVRMADGDGAAVDVQFLHRDSELVAAVDHLHGERLVQLPEIDLAHRDAGALQKARHGEDGPDPHLVRLAGGDGETAEDPERVQPAAFGQLRIHDDARRGAVRELAGVARGDVTLLAGDRLERREALERRVGPVALVLLEQGVLDARLPAPLVDPDLLRRHRHDLGVEAARLLPGGRALLAGQRGPVLPLAGDVVAVAHDLRRLDHRHVDLGLVLLQPLLAQAVQVHVLVLHEADRLESTRDHDRDLVHDHALRGDRDRPQARRAEAGDGRARPRHRQPGAQRRLARDVLARGALRQRAAHHDVLDLAGLDSRALHRVGDDVAADGGAVRVVEGSAVRAADRRAGGGDDDGVCHGSLLVLVRRREHYTGRHGGPLLRGARRGRRAGGHALRARRAVLRRRLPRLAHDQLRRRRVGDARLPLRDVRAPRAGAWPARRAGRRLRRHGRPRRGLHPRASRPVISIRCSAAASATSRRTWCCWRRCSCARTGSSVGPMCGAFSRPRRSSAAIRRPGIGRRYRGTPAARTRPAAGNSAGP